MKLAAENGQTKMRYPTPETAVKIEKFENIEDNSALQTILKKYSDFPKLFKKHFGKDPIVITDSKGNTWYEVDVPENYLQSEW